MKKAFSLITAIIFIVLVASISALSLSLSNINVKQTGDLYFRSQAELLAQSATEFALLGISAHDISALGSCLNSITATFPDANNPIFNIDVKISYLGKGLPASCNIASNMVENVDSNLTVIIDTMVQTNNKNIAIEPIRSHKRTIQKP